jgi:hypothetical protein
MTPWGQTPLALSSYANPGADRANPGATRGLTGGNPGTDGTFSGFARRSPHRQEARRQFPGRFLLLGSPPLARRLRGRFGGEMSPRIHWPVTCIMDHGNPTNGNATHHCRERRTPCWSHVTSWDDGRRGAPLQALPKAREQQATAGSSGPVFLRLGGDFHSALDMANY